MIDPEQRVFGCRAEKTVAPSRLAQKTVSGIVSGNARLCATMTVTGAVNIFARFIFIASAALVTSITIFPVQSGRFAATSLKCRKPTAKKMMSASSARSTVAGIMCGPSSAAISVSDSGPRELAISARMLCLAKMPVRVLPTRPVPTMLYCIAALHLGACAIDSMLSVRLAAVGLLDSKNGPLDSSLEVTKYGCCPSKN
jgi:hypothetical protein